MLHITRATDTKEQALTDINFPAKSPSYPTFKHYVEQASKQKLSEDKCTANVSVQLR